MKKAPEGGSSIRTGSEPECALNSRLSLTFCARGANATIRIRHWLTLLQLIPAAVASAGFEGTASREPLTNI